MKASIRITEAEWEVMTVAWEHAPVAATTVADMLEARKHWSLATVRTLLRRLVDKRALRQETQGKRYLYTPLISVSECIRKESESFLERFLGRSPSEAVLHLVRRVNLSTKEIEELRRILREKEK